MKESASIGNGDLTLLEFVKASAQMTTVTLTSHWRGMSLLGGRMAGGSYSGVREEYRLECGGRGRGGCHRDAGGGGDMGAGGAEPVPGVQAT